MLVKRRHKGQTAGEYAILIVLIMAALLTMQVYFKRGLQGRWRGAIDEIGEQYDPVLADTNIRHTIVSNTNTIIAVVNTEDGYWTRRTDSTITRESKNGFMGTGAKY